MNRSAERFLFGDSGSRAARALLLVALLMILGCGHSPPPPLLFSPEISGSENLTPAKGNPRWWEGFSDPLLNILIETAIMDNLRLQGAWARFRTAAASAAETGATLYPNLTAEGTAGRSRSPSPADSSEGIYGNRFTLGIGAAYEVDLWGRLAALREGAALDALAAESDAAAMRVTITAEVAETWYSLETERARLALLQEQVRTNETYLKLTKLRFGQGLAAAADIYQQRVQLSGTRSRIPLTRSRIATLTHRLNILMGRSPQSPVPIQEEPIEPPQARVVTISTTLLRMRPDIEAARLRVAAADSRAAAALADRFPALRLSLSTGFRASEMAQLFESWIWDMVSSLSGTIFDGGAEAAAVVRARSLAQERLIEYGRTALTAYGEVEDALAQAEGLREYKETLEARIDLAQKSLRETRSRYINGLSDYLPVLTALRTLQSLELEQIDARLELLSNRITLCRTLGGYWI